MNIDYSKINISEISVNHDSQRLKICDGFVCLAQTETYLQNKFSTQNFNYQITTTIANFLLAVVISVEFL